ncbi:MAG: glutamine amidotransferase [Oscillospiraceae bacterium]|nr:glutamine amidotransferase [Oscillospiraceae bacterium]
MSHKPERQLSILHLYFDLMNLYGDWANVEVLALALSARGFRVNIGKKSVGDEIDFGAYDFVYIGSGTEQSLIACISDIMNYKDSLTKCIENGTHILATGNAHELFGRTVTESTGIKHEAVGLLDFETIQGRGRIAGDCVCKPSFMQEKLVGFINRASEGQVGDVERPFILELGPGANDKLDKEGIMYKNLLGTYITGPVLVRNPPLLRYFADKLMGNSSDAESHLGTDAFFAHQELAYKMALSELCARIGKTN